MPYETTDGGIQSVARRVGFEWLSRDRSPAVHLDGSRRSERQATTWKYYLFVVESGSVTYALHQKSFRTASNSVTILNKERTLTQSTAKYSRYSSIG